MSDTYPSAAVEDIAYTLAEGLAETHSERIVLW
jgi:hypothetical protein